MYLSRFLFENNIYAEFTRIFCATIANEHNDPDLFFRHVVCPIKDPVKRLEWNEHHAKWLNTENRHDDLCEMLILVGKTLADSEQEISRNVPYTVDLPDEMDDTVTYMIMAEYENGEEESVGGSFYSDGGKERAINFMKYLARDKKRVENYDFELDSWKKIRGFYIQPQPKK